MTSRIEQDGIMSWKSFTHAISSGEKVFLNAAKSAVKQPFETAQIVSNPSAYLLKKGYDWAKDNLGEKDEEDQFQLELYAKSGYSRYSRDNYSTAPASVEKGLEKILENYPDDTDLTSMLPPLVNLLISTSVEDKLADKGLTLNYGDYQRTYEISNGFLSEIVFSFDPERRIVGVQQYYGNIPGRFIGRRSNAEEISFKIPTGDHLVTAFVLNEITSSSSVVTAVRLITKFGLDSGWIGRTKSKEEKANDYTLICTEYYDWYQETGPDEQAKKVFQYPIFCFDGWTDDDGTLSILSARTTKPYVVYMHQAAKTTTTTTAYESSFSRTWSYSNHSKAEQRITIQDSFENTSQQTINQSETQTNQSTAQLSLSAGAIYGAVSGGINYSQTNSSITTSSTSESLTTMESEQSWFEYPLVVPPMTMIDAVVTVTPTVMNTTVTVVVERFEPGGHSTKEAYDVELNQTGNYEIVVDVQQRITSCHC